MRWVIVSLVLVSLLCTGCLEGKKNGITDPGVEYLSADTPDNVVANFILAMEARDLAALRDEIFYDGILESDDRAAYAPFEFYFDPNGAGPGQILPESIDFECMVITMTNFLSGQPGTNPVDFTEVPGVQSIEMEFAADGAWSDPGDPDHVEGDPYPEGTRERYYQTEIRITLQSNIGDSNINAWLVRDRMRVHVLPVQTAGGTEYRIWKMRDIISGLRSSEESSWGSILAIYLGC